LCSVNRTQARKYNSVQYSKLKLGISPQKQHISNNQQNTLTVKIMHHIPLIHELAVVHRLKLKPGISRGTT